jgi:hypothetical protein
MKNIFIVLLALLLTPLLHAQSLNGAQEDESELYATTKQVNQFFRRFNGEEDTKGERYYPQDKGYHDPGLRRMYLENLFNNDNTYITKDLKNDFIDYVTNKSHPIYLKFHGGNWFAEVTTKFLYHGVEKYLTLFLNLEEDTIGSKWVINNVYFDPFREEFANQDSLRKSGQKFLNPMSHEVDFMNLIKAFKDKSSLEHYLAWKYRPDYLTLFIYEYKKGDLQFETVTNVKFHFFQVDGWYFELSKYKRRGYNNGWLISTLMKVSPSDKEVLMNFIYHE